MAVWTTKDGIELEVAEMETSHIKNCIKLMDKRYSYLVGYGNPSDIDSCFVDEELYSETLIYKEMQKELLMRVK
tara:strand:+ start:370 stop:591 length:222 start_codon:yes stop_codon:yes gene_type:complete